MSARKVACLRIKFREAPRIQRFSDLLCGHLIAGYALYEGDIHGVSDSFQSSKHRAPIIVPNICGCDAQVAVYAHKNPGHFPDKHKLDALSGHIFCHADRCIIKIEARADKSAVVEEATNYIKALQDTLQRLEKQKLEKLQCSNSLSSIAGTSKAAALSTKDTFISNQVSTMDKNDYNPAMERTSNSHLLPAIIQTWSSPNVALNVFGDDARIVVSARKKPGLFANICSVLDQHRLEAFFAHVSSNADCYTYIIQARLASKAPDALPEVLTVEERYKLAADEIMMRISS